MFFGLLWNECKSQVAGSWYCRNSKMLYGKNKHSNAAFPPLF